MAKRKIVKTTENKKIEFSDLPVEIQDYIKDREDKKERYECKMQAYNSIYGDIRLLYDSAKREPEKDNFFNDILLNLLVRIKDNLEIIDPDLDVIHRGEPANEQVEYSDDVPF